MTRRDMTPFGSVGVGSAAPRWGGHLGRASGETGSELNTVWVHGNAFQPEDLCVITSVQRSGWGTLFRGKPGAFTWFHLSVATPVIIDGRLPRLERAFVLYKAIGASIRNVHFYDGTVKAGGFDGLELDGDLSNGLNSLNTWEMKPPLSLHFALGLSIGVQFSTELESAATREILFATAGADFRSARNLGDAIPAKKVKPSLRKFAMAGARF